MRRLLLVMLTMCMTLPLLAQIPTRIKDRRFISTDTAQVKESLELKHAVPSDSGKVLYLKDSQGRVGVTTFSSISGDSIWIDTGPTISPRTATDTVQANYLKIIKAAIVDSLVAAKHGNIIDVWGTPGANFTEKFYNAVQKTGVATAERLYGAVIDVRGYDGRTDTLHRDPFRDVPAGYGGIIVLFAHQTVWVDSPIVRPPFSGFWGSGYQTGFFPTDTFPFDDTVSVLMNRAASGLISNWRLGTNMTRWYDRDFYISGRNLPKSIGISGKIQQPGYMNYLRIDGCKTTAIGLGFSQDGIIFDPMLIANGWGIWSIGSTNMTAYDVNAEQNDSGIVRIDGGEWYLAGRTHTEASPKHRAAMVVRQGELVIDFWRHSNQDSSTAVSLIGAGPSILKIGYIKLGGSLSDTALFVMDGYRQFAIRSAPRGSDPGWGAAIQNLSIPHTDQSYGEAAFASFTYGGGYVKIAGYPAPGITIRQSKSGAAWGLGNNYQIALYDSSGNLRTYFDPRGDLYGTYGDIDDAFVHRLEVDSVMGNLRVTNAIYGWNTPGIRHLHLIPGAAGGQVIINDPSGNAELSVGDGSSTFSGNLIINGTLFPAGGNISINAASVATGFASISTVPGAATPLTIDNDHDATPDSSVTVSSAGLVTMRTIKITGGSPGSGKVLTSDADGDATWEPPTGGGVMTGSQITDSLNNAARTINKTWDFTSGITRFGLASTTTGATEYYNSASAFSLSVQSQAQTANNILRFPILSGTQTIAAGVTAPLTFNTSTGIVGADTGAGGFATKTDLKVASDSLVDGMLTSPFLPRASGASTLTNSSLKEDGGLVFYEQTASKPIFIMFDVLTGDTVSVGMTGDPGELYFRDEVTGNRTLGQLAPILNPVFTNLVTIRDTLWFRDGIVDGDSGFVMVATVDPTTDQLNFGSDKANVSFNFQGIGDLETVLAAKFTTGDSATVFNLVTRFAAKLNMADTTYFHRAFFIRNKPITQIAPTDQYVLKYDLAADSVLWAADVSGGSPAWSSLTDPIAATTYTANAVAESLTVDMQQATTGAGNVMFRVKQTGNPSAGTIFQVQAADADVNIAKFQSSTGSIVIDNAGDMTAIDGANITATEFVGSGSTTVAVDLATAEVGGILPVGNVDTTTANIGLATLGDVALKADKSITLSADSGFGGGGDLSANRAFSVLADYDGALEIMDDSLNVKLDGSTLKRSTAGLAVDTTIMFTQADTTNLNLATRFAAKQNYADTSTWDATRYWSTNSFVPLGGAYTLIDEDGTPTTQWNTINFVGLSVTATSDPAGEETDVTFDADLEDLADGSLSGSKVGSGIDADNITAGTLAIARVGDAVGAQATKDSAGSYWSGNGEIRRIVAGTNITITHNDTGTVIAGPAGGGEANDGGSVGGGLPLYNDKSGVTLRFDTFDPADFDSSSNQIHIDPTKWATQTNVHDSLNASVLGILPVLNRIAFWANATAGAESLASGPIVTGTTSDSLATRDFARNASNINAGTLNVLRLGTAIGLMASRDSNTYLDGSGQWRRPTAGTNMLFSWGDSTWTMTPDTAAGKLGTKADLNAKVDKTEIYALPYTGALDSSNTMVAKVYTGFVSNNETVDTLWVMLSGTSIDIRGNWYSGTTIGTATDSLLSAQWTMSGTNTVLKKVTADMRNSGSLGVKYWWFKANAAATKSPDWSWGFKGHRP